MIQIKNRHLFLAVLLLLGATFLLGGYLGRQKANRASQAQLDLVYGELKRSVIELDNARKYITFVEQQNKTIRQAKKDGDVTIEELKKLQYKTVNELTKAKIKIEVLRDSVKHNGQIITIYDTIYKDNPRKAIVLPFSFKDSTEFYSLKGRFNDNGVLRTELSVPAEFDVYGGYDKKTKELKATVVTNNPFIMVEEVKSFKFDAPKPKKYSISLQAGYGISNKGLSPYIGVGLGYSLLKF